MTKIVETILAMARSISIGGAFFIVTLAGFALCALALLVVLAAVR